MKDSLQNENSIHHRNIPTQDNIPKRFKTFREKDKNARKANALLRMNYLHHLQNQFQKYPEYSQFPNQNINGNSDFGDEEGKSKISKKKRRELAISDVKKNIVKIK